VSASLDELGARKALLVSRLRLERMQVALAAGELRDAVRPAGLIGSAVAKPAAAVAVLESIAPLFGLQRLSRWIRVGLIGIALFRVARNWRKGTRQGAPSAE